jgi:lipopolysaccharide export system protein LptC
MKAVERQTDFRPSAGAIGEARLSRPRPPRGRVGTDRYSRVVALLKRLLPVIGAALLLLVAAWPRLAPLIESVRLAASTIDLREARELKMIDPRYTGTDRLNRPYVVTAAVGRQAPDRSGLMSLEKPHAVMVVHGGAKVVLTAATGVYQSQAQLLDLFGDVTLTHQNGTRFVTQRAHANVAADTAEGDDPVAGHGPSGDIWGQGFRVLDKGDTILFTGRSHAILKGTGAGKPAAPPPALPPTIVKTAAAVEAAAIAAGPTAPPATAPVLAKPTPRKPVEARHHTARRHHPARHAARAPVRHRHVTSKAAQHAD